MAPPGRRKMSLVTLLPLLVLLIFSTTVSAASAVIGIDLGTEYIKAAIAKPGSPIEIVLTKDSKRKEAATLAFKPSRAQTNDADAFPERLYGGDAIALSGRYPEDVYPNLKSLLGLSIDSDVAKTYHARFPALTIQPIPRGDDGKVGSTIGFSSKKFGQDTETFMVEELLAMELKNIKANAEAAVAKGVYVTDAVITFPAFYTAEEKRAIELAAELAGIRLLGLISDGLSVGLNYATNRVFESVTNGAKPEYHLVYDMGAGSTTATVLKFQGRTIKATNKRNQTIQEVLVMGVGYDKSLGGDSLNNVIVQDMLNQFMELPKIKKLNIDLDSVRASGKSMARLWKDAERIRQMLSANSASSASFEGLFDEDVNFKYSLTRDQFEKLAQKHATRVDAPLREALEAAQVSLADLDSIILHGGVVRTPFVQKQLEAAVGNVKKIKTNVNADEAAVMGAAFRAATISPSFRVKEIKTTDISGIAYNLKWMIDGKENKQKMFTPTSQVGAEKRLTVKTLEDVKFEFAQSLEDHESSILEVEATNLTKSSARLQEKYGCAPSNITTVFDLRLGSFNGLPEIISGSVSCVADSSKEGSVMDNVKGLFGFGSKKDTDQEPLGDEKYSEDESSTTMTPLPVSDATSSGTTLSSASPTGASSSSSIKSSKSTKPTTSTVSIPLALKTAIVGLNTPPVTSLKSMQKRLVQFDTSDRNSVLRAEALNTLESFTYRARDYLEDETFIAISPEKLRKELETKLKATSEWLYGDGIDAKLQDFKDKLKSLQTLVDPVLKRKDENIKREPAIKALQSSLESMASMIEMVESGIKKAAEAAAQSASSASSSIVESVIPTSKPSVDDDLDEDPYSTASTADPVVTETEPAAPKPYEYSEEDLSSLTKIYDSIKTWLETKLAAQKKLTPYDDPALLVSELESKSKDLQTAVSDLLMKSIKFEQLKKPKSSKKAKPKTKKTKSSTTTFSTGTGSESTTAASSSSSSSIKDEL